MHLSKLEDLEPFTTLDGSTIREIAGPAWTPARNQSLAEATVPVGGRTVAHYHRVAEELYFFTAGRGRMTLGDEEREVAAGDCVVIPPGQVHGLVNTGAEPLVLLCCCAPAYSHEDTVLVTDQASAG
jgi:mannose-6-phosphate isomerase-like protein (cupin superfamily)